MWEFCHLGFLLNRTHLWALKWKWKGSCKVYCFQDYRSVGLSRCLEWIKMTQTAEHFLQTEQRYESGFHAQLSGQLMERKRKQRAGSVFRAFAPEWFNCRFLHFLDFEKWDCKNHLSRRHQTRGIPKCMCGRTRRQRGPLSFGCQENWGLVTWGCFEEVTSWRCWAGSGLLFPRDKIPLFRVKNNHNKIIPECWERSDFQVWGCWQREWRQSGARLAPLFYIPLSP